MPAAPHDDERSALLARVYSAAGQAEPEQWFVDPASGERMRMRPSEWALQEFDRRAVPTQDGLGADAPETDAPAPERDAGVTHPPAGDPVRRPWLRPALLGGGVAIGVVLVLGVQSVTGGPTRSDPPRAESRTDAESSTVLEVFGQPPLSVRMLPTELLAEFDAIDVQRIFDPSTNGGGYDVFAARKSRDLFCLVVVRTGERYLASCATEHQIQTDGLRLIAVVPAPRPVSLLADVGPTTAPDWQVEVHWNRDGTFSLSGAPVGYDG